MLKMEVKFTENGSKIKTQLESNASVDSSALSSRCKCCLFLTTGGHHFGTNFFGTGVDVKIKAQRTLGCVFFSFSPVFFFWCTW